MLWLKRCIIPTLPHEVIIADVVYPAVLLAYGRSLSLLSAMVGCLQSVLRTLCQSLYNVVVEKDKEGYVVVSTDGRPRVRTPNPHLELPYTYLMTWYIMHCPTLMSAVQSSEDSMPFVQRLECLAWNGWYMLKIRQILQCSMNYQLVRCFPEFSRALYGEKFSDRPLSFRRGFFGGWSTFILSI